MVGMQQRNSLEPMKLVVIHKYLHVYYPPANRLHSVIRTPMMKPSDSQHIASFYKLLKYFNNSVLTKSSWQKKEIGRVPEFNLLPTNFQPLSA